MCDQEKGEKTNAELRITEPEVSKIVKTYIRQLELVVNGQPFTLHTHRKPEMIKKIKWKFSLHFKRFFLFARLLVQEVNKKSENTHTHTETHKK